MRKCWTHNSRVDQAVVPMGGSRARPRCWSAAAGPGRGAGRRRQGLAAAPVGGGGAWPGFETTRRAKLAARTARGRAAVHGHNQQPGPTAHQRRPEHQQRNKQQK